MNTYTVEKGLVRVVRETSSRQVRLLEFPGVSLAVTTNLFGKLDAFKRPRRP